MTSPTRVLALLAFLLCALFPGVAKAFVPPTPQGAVTDTSGRLTAADDATLESHIAAYRARTTNELAVLVVGSLGGESVDDVAYTTFNAWGVGKKGPDNGVLLVIAPNERKMRIETGKGVGDRLTDLEASHILRDRVGPLLKENKLREAILTGLTAIEESLDKGGAGVDPKTNAPKTDSSPSVGFSIVAFLLPIIVLGFCGLVAVVFLVLIIRAISGSANRARSRYGGSYGNDSWSSGGSDYSGGGSSGGSDFGGGGSSGGGGGSDFGGGSSGGGGSSDSY